MCVSECLSYCVHVHVHLDVPRDGRSAGETESDLSFLEEG